MPEQSQANLRRRICLLHFSRLSLEDHGKGSGQNAASSVALSGFFRKAQIIGCRVLSRWMSETCDLHLKIPEIHLWTCRPDVTGRRGVRLLRFRKSCKHDVHSQSQSELPNFRQSNDAEGYSVPAKTRRNAATPASAKFSSRLLVCTRSFNLFWKAFLVDIAKQPAAKASARRR